MNSLTFSLLLLCLSLQAYGLQSRQYHVSPSGKDSYAGTKISPLKSISAAAALAHPGDTITVHEGIYRERINPPRGGSDENNRIVYRAAPGEQVVIKGSEIVKDWEHLKYDTWKTIIPNSFFGDFNAFDDEIRGDWFDGKGRTHHSGAIFLNGHWLTEAATLDGVLCIIGDTPKWFAEVDTMNNGHGTTTIWAQFKDVDPNKELVEATTRQTVFYPDKPGRNFITVRGFILEQAATPWAPPTAEQIGLIGTHWSKGWIIEDNTIRYSTCVGISLGKYGDEWDNIGATSDAYNESIVRARNNGWNKGTVGGHLIRNNHIYNCEQAGIVGSMGCSFSNIIGNEIHDIHVRKLFTGAEMAGIKFHAPVDLNIVGNHIYRTHMGIWLDWMTQGTRVSGNLLHDNYGFCDLHLEVNHGPYLVDNNIFLSTVSVVNSSQGGAFAHNLFVGQIRRAQEFTRETPYLEAHGTAIKGLSPIQSGDDRFLNNVFVPSRLQPTGWLAAARNGMEAFNGAEAPMIARGNLFFPNAPASEFEQKPVQRVQDSPNITFFEKEDGFYLTITVDEVWTNSSRSLVTSAILGKTRTGGENFEQPDGTPYRIDTDYFGKKRNFENPTVGPFEITKTGKQMIQVWPKD